MLWVILSLAAVVIAILAVDILRWQMIRGIFWRPRAIDPEKETVVIIDPMHRPPEKNRIVNPAYFLADFIVKLADVNIDLIHYPLAGTERVMRHAPVCVLLSGQVAPWTDYKAEDMAPVFEFIKESSLPVLGICGGHQVIAQAFGAPVAPMGYQEIGYIKVELEGEAPLFEGLQSPLTVFSFHGEEVKEAPPGFEVLGSSKRCRIQCMRHRERSLYGVQFHPELSGRKPDGIALLRNFLRRAGVTLR